MKKITIIYFLLLMFFAVNCSDVTESNDSKDGGNNTSSTPKYSLSGTLYSSNTNANTKYAYIKLVAVGQSYTAVALYGAQSGLLVKISGSILIGLNKAPVITLYQGDYFINNISAGNYTMYAYIDYNNDADVEGFIPDAGEAYIFRNITISDNTILNINHEEWLSF